MPTNMTTPTKSAVRAAEKFFNIESHEGTKYSKSVLELAAIIDRETGILELIAIARDAKRLIESEDVQFPPEGPTRNRAIELLRKIKALRALEGKE